MSSRRARPARPRCARAWRSSTRRSTSPTDTPHDRPLNRAILANRSRNDGIRARSYDPFMYPLATRLNVRLAELLGVLSLGTDVGLGQPMEHALRQCVI